MPTNCYISIPMGRSIPARGPLREEIGMLFELTVNTVSLGMFIPMVFSISPRQVVSRVCRMLVCIIWQQTQCGFLAVITVCDPFQQEM